MRRARHRKDSQTGTAGIRNERPRSERDRQLYEGFGAVHWNRQWLACHHRELKSLRRNTIAGPGTVLTSPTEGQIELLDRMIAIAGSALRRDAAYKEFLVNIGAVRPRSVVHVQQPLRTRARGHRAARRVGSSGAGSDDGSDGPEPPRRRYAALIALAAALILAALFLEAPTFLTSLAIVPLAVPADRLGWKVSELPTLMGVPLRSLYQEIYDGRLAAVRVGKRGLWVSRAALEAWQSERAYQRRKGASVNARIGVADLERRVDAIDQDNREHAGEELAGRVVRGGRS